MMPSSFCSNTGCSGSSPGISKNVMPPIGILICSNATERPFISSERISPIVFSVPRSDVNVLPDLVSFTDVISFVFFAVFAIVFSSLSNVVLNFWHFLLSVDLPHSPTMKIVRLILDITEQSFNVFFIQPHCIAFLVNLYESEISE